MMDEDGTTPLVAVELFLDSRHDLYVAHTLGLGQYTIERRAGLPDNNSFEVMRGTGHHGLFQYLPDAVWSVLQDDTSLALHQLHEGTGTERRGGLERRLYSSRTVRWHFNNGDRRRGWQKYRDRDDRLQVRLHERRGTAAMHPDAVKQARAIIVRAHQSLGRDLEGSYTDLLLDNMEELDNTDIARRLAAAVFVGATHRI